MFKKRLNRSYVQNSATTRGQIWIFDFWTVPFKAFFFFSPKPVKSSKDSKQLNMVVAIQNGIFLSCSLLNPPSNFEFNWQHNMHHMAYNWSSWHLCFWAWDNIAMIITFEKLVLVSTIVVCQKKRKDTEQILKTKRKMSETNTAGAQKFNYSCHKLYKPAASPVAIASPSLCIVLVYVQNEPAFSATQLKGHFLVLLKCFLWAVAHSGESSPLWCKAWEQLLILCAGSGGSIVCTRVWGGSHHTPWTEVMHTEYNQRAL